MLAIALAFSLLAAEGPLFACEDTQFTLRLLRANVANLIVLHDEIARPHPTNASWSELRYDSNDDDGVVVSICSRDVSSILTTSNGNDRGRANSWYTYTVCK